VTLDTNYFKNLLLKLRRELTGQMNQVIETGADSTMKEASGDHSSYSFHIADMGSDTMDREQSFIYVQRDGMTLQAIDDALERIETGEYGLCAGCSVKIPHERLEFIPYALHCIRCQAELEKVVRAIEDEWRDEEEW
jgi:RNA polymerase-binding transcription factor DksA